MRQFLVVLVLIAPLLFASGPAAAQVHYEPDGSPWNRRADGGPDAVVDGWYYNLGITGLRVELVADAPKELVVRHVLADSPAAGRVVPGDRIVGVGGRRFRTEHRNGYGMDRFGAAGPMLEFAGALERAADRRSRGRLEVDLTRNGKAARVELSLGRGHLAYGRTYPDDCRKSDRIRAQLCDYLVGHQGEDGSWGSPPHDAFAPLALLASDEARYLPAIRKNVEMHARTTKAVDDSSLINWRYMAAAIVLCEYFLATGEKWVLKEIQEVYDFLVSSQYTDLSQVDERVAETHPDSYPRGPLDSHGGWGHNPGFEGYGPIAMLTGQGALALALMKRCGIDVDRARHDAAYAFLERGTGPNGYLWYGDEVADPRGWADMGRTGAAGIANLLTPYRGGEFHRRALAHARVIGEHPESFPDTHGSPVMGMGYAALAARIVPESFRSLMDANRWWFVLARCPDGSFYYQPNRDNAGYGADSRISATAVTAFIFSIPRGNLVVTGRR